MSVSVQAAQEVAKETGININICKAILESNNNDKRDSISKLKTWTTSPSITEKPDSIYGEIVSFYNSLEQRLILVKFTATNKYVFSDRDMLEYMDSIIFCEAAMSPIGDNLTEDRKRLEKKFNCIISHETEKMSKGDNRYLLTSYIHSNGLSGSMIEIKLDEGDDNILLHPKMKQFAFDLAMHVVAFNPMGFKIEQFPPKLNSEIIKGMEKELNSSGKSVHLWNDIIEGKIKKMYRQNSLLSQIFIKSKEDTVSQIKDKLEKSLECKFTITRFARKEV